MSKRLFDVDPVTGTVQWFHWDESSKGKEMIIQTQQRTDEIIEANKERYNNASNRWGEGQMIASLPLTIWGELSKKGILRDKKALRRWLNDPDNAVFRTRPGRI